MKYPSGVNISIGDLIWWDEGYCVGHVHEIFEFESEYKKYGLNGPGLYLGNSHPFNRKNGAVVYELSDLEDEGIDLLSPVEIKCFNNAISRAGITLSPQKPFSACLVVENNKPKTWQFQFSEDEVITVPHTAA